MIEAYLVIAVICIPLFTYFAKITGELGQGLDNETALIIALLLVALAGIWPIVIIATVLKKLSN